MPTMVTDKARLVSGKQYAVCCRRLLMEPGIEVTVDIGGSNKGQYSGFDTVTGLFLENE